MCLPRSSVEFCYFVLLASGCFAEKESSSLEVHYVPCDPIGQSVTNLLNLIFFFPVPFQNYVSYFSVVIEVVIFQAPLKWYSSTCFFPLSIRFLKFFHVISCHSQLSKLKLWVVFRCVTAPRFFIYFLFDEHLVCVLQLYGSSCAAVNVLRLLCLAHYLPGREVQEGFGWVKG